MKKKKIKKLREWAEQKYEICVEKDDFYKMMIYRDVISKAKEIENE